MDLIFEDTLILTGGGGEGSGGGEGGGGGGLSGGGGEGGGGGESCTTGKDSQTNSKGISWTFLTGSCQYPSAMAHMKCGRGRLHLDSGGCYSFW